MIYPKVIFILLSIIIFTPLAVAKSEHCRSGDTKTLEYIKRDNNRCEGIKRDTLSGNGLMLISISTSELDISKKNVEIEVPNISNDKEPKVKPKVVVKSLGDNYHYQLYPLSLSPLTVPETEEKKFEFIWSNYVLKQMQERKILTSNVRGLASYNFGSQLVYAPVILGKKGNSYNFVFYSIDRVKFPYFKIYNSGNQEVYTSKTSNYKSGEIIFTWDGRNSPAGRYTLSYIGDIERKNQPSQQVPKKIIFAHNPNWLK